MEPTGKRSKGSTSQTAIWKLKPEFKNPTPEIIKKIQENATTDIDYYSPPYTKVPLKSRGI